MDKSIFGNKLNLGALNGLTKKVAATEAPKQAPAQETARIAGDSLVRGGTVAAPGAGVGNAAQAAELRLAKAYDADPATFARNLARLSLEEMVSNLG